MAKKIILIMAIVILLIVTVSVLVLQFNHEQLKECFQVLQAIVIIVATIFTAWWTYKTFAYRERMNSLIEIKKFVEYYKFNLDNFYGQIRENKEINNEEMMSRVKVELLHSKTIETVKNSLYFNDKFRRELIKQLGPWLSANRLHKMIRYEDNSHDENKVLEEYRKYNIEYKSILQLIEKEAERIR